MKVLIVDDSDLLQTRLKVAILRADNSICLSQAYTYKEALDLYPLLTPDLVVLDIALPDGSGIDLLRIFKNGIPGVTLAMFTNYPTAEFKKRCIELGADYFFDKSNLTELIRVIESKRSLNYCPSDRGTLS